MRKEKDRDRRMTQKKVIEMRKKWKVKRGQTDIDESVVYKKCFY